MVDAKYKTQFYIDETNDATGPVVRWNSNNAIPFGDMLQEFVNAGWIDRQTENNSLVQRKVEDRRAIENYRKNYRGPSDEERFEARAAFGPGARVVNVLTGHAYTV
jgi:hypothetical protein